MWWLVLIGSLAVVGCSSNSTSAKQAKPNAGAAESAKNTNPLAKYIEVVGFRILEKTPGHLQVQFAVVNHSEADLGDVKMDINLRTTAGKPGDPPLISFPVKVASVGPSELKQVTVEVPTKLRVYELPDWQFLRADFVLIEPQGSEGG